ncbi:hypothetical protein FPSE_11122 [Fusarium pseudograminearum CS3096]|uniref:Uncharacterized protein n=1 Tax=Fusarium pseudograminearum (strain CS3096) TaxID=1028729 RepID=K3VXD3_FUSPC|nr:hypothetical protein FPSE_11122 [Fusarium pseudograminearum CS3096]EKJ68700.1 hypothetical protein FPSE_11122 [Fusarium pseudograminearum CS3096]
MSNRKVIKEKYLIELVRFLNRVIRIFLKGKYKYIKIII